MDYFNVKENEFMMRAVLNKEKFISTYNQFVDELNLIEKQIKTGLHQKKYKNFLIQDMLIIASNNKEVRVGVKLGGYNPEKYPDIEEYRIQINEIKNKYFPL